MNVKEAFYFIQTKCDTLYDAAELKEISWRILEHLSGKTKFELSQHAEVHIGQSQLEQITKQLQQNRPIQYILGYEYFGNLKLKVNEAVLIPRPETEELCRLAIKKIKENKQANVRILDIGTGSACIPILIKNEIPAASVYALDISTEALAVAKENAVANNADIHFLEADILADSLTDIAPFDFIISNPPYILQSEKKTMHARILEHEPHVALFVIDDPLLFYRAILLFAKKNLKEKGMLFLELNNLYAAQIKALYKTEGYAAEIVKDLYGNERFLIADFGG